MDNYNLFENPIILEEIFINLENSDLIKLSLVNTNFHHFTRKELFRRYPYKFYISIREKKLDNLFQHNKKELVLSYLYLKREKELLKILVKSRFSIKYFIRVFFSYEDDIYKLDQMFFYIRSFALNYLEETLIGIIKRQNIVLLERYFSPKTIFYTSKTKYLSKTKSDFFFEFFKRYELYEISNLVLSLLKKERLDLIRILNHILKERFINELNKKSSLIARIKNREFLSDLAKIISEEENKKYLSKDLLLICLIILDEKNLKNKGFTEEKIIKKCILLDKFLSDDINELNLIKEGILYSSRNIYLSRRDITLNIIKERGLIYFLSRNLFNIIEDFYDDFFSRELNEKKELISPYLYKNISIEYFRERIYKGNSIRKNKFVLFLLNFYSENLELLFKRILRKEKNFYLSIDLFPLIDEKNKKLLNFCYESLKDIKDDYLMSYFIRMFEQYKNLSTLFDLIDNGFSYECIKYSYYDQEKIIQEMKKRKIRLNSFLAYYIKKKDISIFQDREKSEIENFLFELYEIKRYDLFLRTVEMLNFTLERNFIFLILRGSNNIYLFEKLLEKKLFLDIKEEDINYYERIKKELNFYLNYV